MVKLISTITVYACLEFFVNTMENLNDVATWDFIMWMHVVIQNHVILLCVSVCVCVFFFFFSFTFFLVFLLSLISSCPTRTDHNKIEKYKGQDKCLKIISIFKASLLVKCRWNSNLIWQQKSLLIELTRTHYKTTK